MKICEMNFISKLGLMIILNVWNVYLVNYIRTFLVNIKQSNS